MLYAVRVRKITNDLLMERGWKVGSWVRLEDSEWLLSKTLRLSSLPSLFNEEIFGQIKSLAKQFVGVGDEIVELEEGRSFRGPPMVKIEGR